METMIRSLLLVLCAAAAAQADTVTMTSHLSVNGDLKQMSGGVITLGASFAAGTRTLSIQLSAVDTISFNSTTFNPDAPPKVLGIGPPKGSPPESREAAAMDTIVLRGNQRKDCKLLSIDADTVHCSGKGGDYNRRTVLRILVGAP
jgi:hypothetical protein